MARDHSVDMADGENGRPKDNIIRRGRGFKSQSTGLNSRNHEYDSIEANPDQSDAQPSVEGWVLVIANIHPEAMEEDLRDKFADYGVIKSLNQILDRQTGYCKGYALLEYANYNEAKSAINDSDEIDILGQKVNVDFAFKRPPPDAGEPVRIDPIVRERKRPTTIDDRLGDGFDRHRSRRNNGDDDAMEDGEVEERGRDGRGYRGRRNTYRPRHRKPYSRPEQRRRHPDDPSEIEKGLGRDRDEGDNTSRRNNHREDRRRNRSLSPRNY